MQKLQTSMNIYNETDMTMKCGKQVAEQQTIVPRMHAVLNPKLIFPTVYKLLYVLI